MRAVVQRVHRADVTVDGEVRAVIGKGLLVYLAVAEGDTEEDAAYLVEKLAGLRIFEDEGGKMNLSIRQVGGEIMVISAFTVLADARKGRRPSLVHAAAAQQAEALYRLVCDRLSRAGVSTCSGVFAAHMDVASLNDGPICLLLDSKRLL